MKKIILACLFLGVSAMASAWEVSEMSVNERSFVLESDSGKRFEINEVSCTKSDGYDAINIVGYTTPLGRWVSLNRYISKGHNIRQQLNKMDSSLLPAYMKFCAKVNRLY